MANGGYDDGYAVCPCFWGHEPGSLIAEIFKIYPSMNGMRVLDAGCGEGKNAHAMAMRGAGVVAIDCSERALENGRSAFSDENIDWRCDDVRSVRLGRETFDVVIAYGLFHCLRDETQIADLVDALKLATCFGGYNVVCAFNSRSQDLSAHPEFQPCLLDHRRYLSLYEGWKLLAETDSDLHETHPHNRIPHVHSMTRFIAQRTT